MINKSRRMPVDMSWYVQSGDINLLLALCVCKYSHPCLSAFLFCRILNLATPCKSLPSATNWGICPNRKEQGYKRCFSPTSIFLKTTPNLSSTCRKAQCLLPSARQSLSNQNLACRITPISSGLAGKLITCTRSMIIPLQIRSVSSDVTWL